MSVRLGVAQAEGVDESMLDRVDAYASSDLSSRHRAALRAADAFQTDPLTLMTDELVSELRAHFSPTEIVELFLDMVAWSQQKRSVALGLDDPVDPGRLSILVMTEEGWGVAPDEQRYARS
jgi:hypothetical protein